MSTVRVTLTDDEPLVLGGLRMVLQPDDTIEVVVLTTFADDSYLVEAARASASGYLLKSMPPADIRASIHVVNRGETSLAPVLVG